MQNILRDISSYTDYLIRTHHLFISFHACFADSIIYSDELIRYNFHLSPYCRYIKTVCGTWDKCVEKQKKVIEKCKDGEFCGSCYAGVLEYVYPIESGITQTGFICVSGYRQDIDRTKIAHYAEKYVVSYSKLERQWNTELSDKVPDKEFIDTLIHPLTAMFLLAYDKLKSPAISSDPLMQSVIHYINQNHTSKITMGMLAERFHCSVSTLSHRFKKSFGVSISEYVNDLRINESAWLLSSSELSLAEISETLGFGSPNYFSSVFTEHYKVPPKTYRLTHKK